MFGIPLHPLVVHFPIVLSVLLPLAILGALWLIQRGGAPRRVWALPFGLAVALTASAFVATETGEAEEDRVERVVGDSPLHEHEEAAERFLVLSGVLAVIAAAGLLPGTVGRASRLVSAAGAVVLVAAGVQVGHSGGSLVYRHGAACAYTDSATAAGQVAEASAGEARRGAPVEAADDH